MTMLKNVPAPGRGAPRPTRKSAEVEQESTLDNPPAAKPQDQPLFDRGTAAADEEARTGDLTHGKDAVPPDDTAG